MGLVATKLVLGFRLSEIQTSLLNDRGKVENLNFALNRSRCGTFQ